MFDSVRPHRWQPTRLSHPWDSPGKNTGVGCHFLLQCMKVKVKSLSRVQLFMTPWTAAHHAPLPMGFSRQDYWSGSQLPSSSMLAPKFFKLLADFCWEILFHGSLMFAHDLWRGTNCLCSVSTTFSVGVNRHSIFLWRETHVITIYCNKDVSLQSKGQACLILIIKYLGSWSSGYLPERQPTACIGVTWPSSHCPVGPGIREPAQILTLIDTIGLSNEVPFL